VLARKTERKKERKERPFMSKKSCEAAESIEDALLRMARVNCNKYSAQNYTAAESGVVKTRTGIGHFACCRFVL